MDLSVIGAIAQWGATLVVAGTLVYTIRRNGKKEKQSDTELKTELKKDIEGITKKLDDPNEGLGSIKRDIGEMKQRCAAVTSGCTERFRHTEEDIQELKSKWKRSRKG